MHNFSSKSIAVLPFINLSSKTENEYFCDGITEEIINALTTIKGLKVIARTSSFAYKGKQIDIRNIGKELGVNSVLEGSIRFQNKRVRITAQLINTLNGFHYWSQNFDRELEDIFELQDEISILIADKIRENFGHLIVHDTLVINPNISSEAYSHFLRAKALIAEFNKNSVTQGIDLLKEIILEYPYFAPAHASVHYAYNMMAAGGLIPMQEALDIGTIYLNKAHELDDKLPEVYHSKGWNALNKDWDFVSAVAHLKKALELKPNYSDAHQKLFITLILEGNLKDAGYHIKEAHKLDPLLDLNNYFMAYNAYINSDFENSNKYFSKCFEINKKFIVGYSINALALVQQQKPDKIFELAESIPEMEGVSIERLQMKAIAYAAQENKQKLTPVLNELTKLLKTKSRERVRFFLVYVYTLLNEHNSALDLIDEGIKHKEPLMTLIKVDPLLKPLHKLQRFKNQLAIVYKLSNLKSQNKVQPIKQLVPNELIEPYKQRLIRSMVEEKEYLNTSLTLRKLAEDIKIHPNQLSWLLNESLRQNFNEFLNRYRLKHFKKLAVSPNQNHLTILGLAYESGFNSKSVFNSFFKKEEGTTPKKWLDANL